jgi:hypothetical protein
MAAGSDVHMRLMPSTEKVAEERAENREQKADEETDCINGRFHRLLMVRSRLVSFALIIITPPSGNHL